MRALMLLGTLKRQGLSNTETLCEFLAGRMREQDVESELVKLVDHNVLPGTYSDMGEGDAWPRILEKIRAADALIFATPVWWGGHSSEIQRVIERLDEVHDEILEGKTSMLEGKIGGIVITGDSDGAEHIIGNVSNFFNAIGILLPPYATLSVLTDAHAKSKTPSRKQLLATYEKDYTESADRMVEQLVRFSRPGRTDRA